MKNPPEQLPEHKRAETIRAAIKEFAHKGYKAASTNAITREAGISKGLLFHYFGNKKDLYLEVLNKCLDHYMSVFKSNLGDLSSDVFDRMLQIGELKMRMFNDAPDMYRLVTEAFVNTPEEIQPDIEAKQKALLQDTMPTFVSGLDLSKFRDDVDPMKAIQLIMSCSEALSTKYTGIVRQTGQDLMAIMPAALDEIREVMRMIKHGVYR